MKLRNLITFDTSLSIAGSLFVSFGNSYIANCLWAVGNLLLLRKNYMSGDSSQCFLFFVFEIVAIVGIINHWRGIY